MEGRPETGKIRQFLLSSWELAVYFTKLVRLAEIEDIGDLLREFPLIGFANLREFDKALGERARRHIVARLKRIRAPFIWCGPETHALGEYLDLFESFGKCFPNLDSSRAMFVVVRSADISREDVEFLDARVEYIDDHLEQQTEEWEEYSNEEYAVISAFRSLYSWCLSNECQGNAKGLSKMLFKLLATALKKATSQIA